MVEVLSKPIAPDRLAAALARHCAPNGVAPSVAGTLADLGPQQTQALVTLMLERLEDEVPALFDAISDGRTADRARIAHQLKGAVGNFDMPELVSLLAAVESGDAQAEQKLRPALHLARTELQRSLSALRVDALMPAAQ